ncbi:hypothetical protein ON010_g18941 [Phytophthora cinnamomi]|nr:hypothetical protein ON010_g18941 [Phytophthora cinnamomi]
MTAGVGSSLWMAPEVMMGRRAGHARAAVLARERERQQRQWRAAAPGHGGVADGVAGQAARALLGVHGPGHGSLRGQLRERGPPRSPHGGRGVVLPAGSGPQPVVLTAELRCSVSISMLKLGYRRGGGDATAAAGQEGWGVSTRAVPAAAPEHGPYHTLR